jgi:hypothetical protein
MVAGIMLLSFLTCSRLRPCMRVRFAVHSYDLMAWKFPMNFLCLQVIDVHTHLFPPSHGDLMLWGIDALLTYHYRE